MELERLSITTLRSSAALQFKFILTDQLKHRASENLNAVGANKTATGDAGASPNHPDVTIADHAWYAVNDGRKENDAKLSLRFSPCTFAPAMRFAHGCGVRLVLALKFLQERRHPGAGCQVLHTTPPPALPVPDQRCQDGLVRLARI